MRPDPHRLLRLILMSIPVFLAILVRSQLSSYFEFESQEDTVRALAIIENGDLPLYGIGHIRFLGAALGPLVYYLKAIPYLFHRDPLVEVIFLFILHIGAIIAAQRLTADIVGDWLKAARPSLDAQKRVLLTECSAALLGVFMAMSLYSNAMTSHAHPSYYASALMIPFVFAVHRFCRGGTVRYAVLAGVCLGVITQLYQLALFAPFFMVLLLVSHSRLPTRREAGYFFLPLFLCYLPYLLSEFQTGFWNTRSLFVFQPGPTDDGMMESSWALNLRFLVNATISYIGWPPWLDGFTMIFSGTGLVSMVLWFYRVPAVRTMLLWLSVYGLATALVLTAPRLQLVLPVPQFLLLMGILQWSVWARRIWQSKWRWHGSVTMALAGVVLFLLALPIRQSAPVDLFRSRLFYPIRVADFHPIGRMMTLEDSRLLLTELRQSYGIGLPELTEQVSSPLVASGMQGHHYLIRALEETVPAGPLVAGQVFVHDDLFPYEVHGRFEKSAGRFKFAVLDAGAISGGSLFKPCVTGDCSIDEKVDAPLKSRFFWGCGEYRDLDPRLGIPPEECEEILTSKPANRVYEAMLRAPVLPDQNKCPDCRPVLFVTKFHECGLMAHVGGQPLSFAWHNSPDRHYGFAQLPARMEDGRGHRLRIELTDCVPYTFNVVAFQGRPVTRVE